MKIALVAATSLLLLSACGESSNPAMFPQGNVPPSECRSGDSFDCRFRHSRDDRTVFEETRTLCGVREPTRECGLVDFCTKGAARYSAAYRSPIDAREYRADLSFNYGFVVTPSVLDREPEAEGGLKIAMRMSENSGSETRDVVNDPGRVQSTPVVLGEDLTPKMGKFVWNGSYGFSAGDQWESVNIHCERPE